MAPEHKLRVIAPDVGGNFGSKIFIYPEEVVCLWASRKIGRPVRWVSERSEAFLADAHGRDHVTHAEMAFDAEGKVTGLKVKTIANLGAYMSTFSSSVPTYLYGTLLSGQYEIPAILREVDAVYQYGAGRRLSRRRPPRSDLRGRAADGGRRPRDGDRSRRSAEELHQEFSAPDAGDHDLRRRRLPCFAQEGAGDRRLCRLRQAQAQIRPSRQAARRSDSRPISRPAALRRARPSARSAAASACRNPPKCGSIRPARSKSSPAATSTARAETTFAQVVSERLGIPFDNVSVVHGDTDKVQFGMGTYGSRSGAVGISAIVKALDKVEAKAKKVAAQLLEAAEGDIVFKDGKFTIAGTDKSAAWGDVALNAYIAHKFAGQELEPGLKEGAFYDPTNFTFPAGCHICEVEVDRETGESEIVAWTAVDDFGTVVNPMIVEGQVHGGIAQGVGQALLEGAIYDKDGQLVTGSLMDYCVPRAPRSADAQGRHDEDQGAVRSARHQGLRRGRRDRGAGRRHQRHHQRDRHRGFGDAGHRADGVAGIAESRQQPQGGLGRSRCTHSPIIVRGPCGRQRACWPSRKKPSCSPAATR